MLYRLDGGQIRGRDRDGRRFGRRDARRVRTTHRERRAYGTATDARRVGDPQLTVNDVRHSSSTGGSRSPGFVALTETAA
jgi:hypothetical protein